MTEDGKENQDPAEPATGQQGATGATGKPERSLAARRRRIEMRRELMAMLDDFGDGEADLALLDEEEGDSGSWVMVEEGSRGDESSSGTDGEDSSGDFDGLDDDLDPGDDDGALDDDFDDEN